MKKLNKKSLIPFILFVFLCILIYTKFGIIDVKAETYQVDKDFYVFVNERSYTFSTKIPFKNFQYHTNSNNFDLFSMGFALKNLSLTYSDHFSNYDYNLIENFDNYIGYYTLHFKYYYNISNSNNFSFLKWLHSEDPYSSQLYDFYDMELYDSAIYTSLDENGVVTYDEFVILKSNNITKNLNNNYWGLDNKTYNNMVYFYSYIPVDSNNFTALAAPNVDNSFIELLDAYITNDSTNLPISINTIIENSDISYSSPDLLPYEEEFDNSIIGFIKRIFNKLVQIGRGILTFPKTLLNIITSGIQSIFIPRPSYLQERFIYNFNLVKNQLGFLFTPFELIAEILDKYQNLGNSNGIIPIPEIKDPIYNQTIIPAQNWNLYNIFTSNSTLNNAYSLYLNLVDVFLIIWLVNMFLRKFNSVFSGDGEKE